MHTHTHNLRAITTSPAGFGWTITTVSDFIKTIDLLFNISWNMKDWMQWYQFLYLCTASTRPPTHFKYLYTSYKYSIISFLLFIASGCLCPHKPSGIHNHAWLGKPLARVVKNSLNVIHYVRTLYNNK